MSWERAETVSWSVRHRGGPPLHARDTAAALQTVLAARFPESAGYELDVFRLSGPMSGSVFRVTRGDFRARVTLQMYRRGRKTSTETHELRLIGSVTSGRIERARRQRSRWRAAGRALGLALGSVTFLAAAWGLAALFGDGWLAAGSPLWVASVVPAGILGWMSGSVTQASLAQRGRVALRAASSDALDDAALREALADWQAVVPALSGHREMALGRGLAQPFRARALAPAQ